ncbi:hypothetical protein OSTOST_25059, partial [Ostertagia ostertagi]
CVGIQCDELGTLHCNAETNATSSVSTSETKSCQTDEGAIVPALENKLLEYKDTMTELECSVKELSSENTRLISIVQEKEAKIVSLLDQSKLLNADIAKKDDFISHALRALSTIKESTGQESVSIPEHCVDGEQLDKEALMISEYISRARTTISKAFDEKAATEMLVSESPGKS